MKRLGKGVYVEFADGSDGIYHTKEEAEAAILEAHRDNVGVDKVTDSNYQEDSRYTYRVIWSVKLYRKFKEGL